MTQLRYSGRSCFATCVEGVLVLAFPRALAASSGVPPVAPSPTASGSSNKLSQGVVLALRKTFLSKSPVNSLPRPPRRPWTSCRRSRITMTPGILYGFTWRKRTSEPDFLDDGDDDGEDDEEVADEDDVDHADVHENGGDDDHHDNGDDGDDDDDEDDDESGDGKNCGGGDGDGDDDDDDDDDDDGGDGDHGEDDEDGDGDGCGDGDGDANGDGGGGRRRQLLMS